MSNRIDRDSHVLIDTCICKIYIYALHTECPSRIVVLSAQFKRPPAYPSHPVGSHPPRPLPIASALTAWNSRSRPQFRCSLRRPSSTSAGQRYLRNESTERSQILAVIRNRFLLSQRGSFFDEMGSSNKGSTIETRNVIQTNPPGSESCGITPAHGGRGRGWCARPASPKLAVRTFPQRLAASTPTSTTQLTS